MLGNAAYLESSRRESRKRRRLSERRRVFSRLGLEPTGDYGSQYGGQSSFSASRDRRRSSNLTSRQQADSEASRCDSPTSMLMASGDRDKIAMKIQFYITVAPDNEPLILDTCQLITSQQQQSTAGPGAAATGKGPPSSGSSAKRMSSDQSAIGEQISELLNRQSSSTRRRQQLLALHQQSALDKPIAKHNQHSISPSFQPTSQQPAHGHTSGNSSIMVHSENNLALAGAGSTGDSYQPAGSREPGARSSTITGGMQDEATVQFLANTERQRQTSSGAAGAGLGSTAPGSLIGQHQTLMSSSSNIRQRLEQREHIYFKRDGQRFGHEFTLKLSVDKNYRCLMKVRPLIPLQAISIQGHLVPFVDCSSSSSFSTSSSSSGGGGGSSSMSSSAPASSTTLNGNNSPVIDTIHTNGLRHQSIGGASPAAALPHEGRHNSIGPATNLAPNSRLAGGPSSQNYLLNSHYSQLRKKDDQNYRRLNHAQTTIGATGARRPSSNLYSDVPGAAAAVDQDDPMSGGGPTALVNGARVQLQQQLLKQQQHNQMVRHFSATHSSSSSSHLGSQLVYMFDWSASRFEVNKNKARTQVHTVLKFNNGQILSLPLQVKFYQPECRQHLSWGSQLHFIDYDCNIDSMGQINVNRIQYY